MAEIEKKMQNFLWDGCQEIGGHYFVAWKDVCKPKELGGLGIGNIWLRNRTLICKWLWGFPLEQEALWHKIIKSKYGLRPLEVYFTRNGGFHQVY